MLADPRYLWYSDQHKEAKLQIEYRLKEKNGPIYLSAQVGLGKTSLAKRIRQELSSDERRIAMAFAPNLKTANQFLRFVADEFQVETARSYAQTLKNFQAFLIEQYTLNISPVLLIDEAQNLTHDTLKTIHHLFNFTTDTEFLLQMALFGQPELEKKIVKFESLNSRMHQARLEPFDLAQTKKMMQFRWRVSGGIEETFPFNDGAVEEIHQLSGGVARTVCKLAESALIVAVISHNKVIDREMIIQATGVPSKGEE